jgi:hypothetical protein
LEEEAGGVPASGSRFATLVSARMPVTTVEPPFSAASPTAITAPAARSATAITAQPLLSHTGTSSNAAVCTLTCFTPA